MSSDLILGLGGFNFLTLKKNKAIHLGYSHYFAQQVYFVLQIPKTKFHSKSSKMLSLQIRWPMPSFLVLNKIPEKSTPCLPRDHTQSLS